jgi:hypothetical protein
MFLALGHSEKKKGSHFSKNFTFGATQPTKKKKYKIEASHKSLQSEILFLLHA